jgi:ribosomal protein S18 acetylase RimI-like enzyme
MYTIRKAEPRDIDQLIDLCDEHAQYEGCDYDKEGKQESVRIIFEQDSPVKCLVIESNEELVGYSTFMKQFSTWDAKFYVYMDCLYLTSETRGNGLGKKLMSHIESYASAELCTVIQWQTPKSNEKAIMFYNRYGAIGLDKKRFFLELG